ncbi:MAG: DNA cytosine methyltransferase [Beijerinckiaceae bacterium]|nr:DNA cytosine methyltransferase [Beijerinckiaceae bacterium]
MREGARYLSVCSGIEAWSVACAGLGYEPVGFSEIDPFASAVLAERFGSNLPGQPYPGNAPPNFGDFTAIPLDRLGRVDLLVGGTPCFPGDVRIACRHGLIQIAEVKVGDEVLTHEGRWRRVLATGSKVAPTIRLKGQGQSYGLITTAEHPFYSRKKSSVWVGRENGSYASRLSEPEWVEAAHMGGRMWASPASWPVSQPPAMDTEGREKSCPEMSAELAWVIGRWLGDGWCRVDDRRGYAIICCGRHEADLLADAIARSGLAFSRLQERTTERFQIASRSFARWLTGQFGSGAGEKTMPTWVFGWEHRSALLDGYLSADGSRADNGRRLTTVSEALALSTVLLAHSLGFSASRSRHAPQRDTQIEGRAVSERPFWTVKIYDRARSSIEVGIHRWGVVRSIEDAGDAEVFNLEVEGDNSYVADGFVVHNCQAFSFAGKRLSLEDARGNLTLAFAVLAHELAGSHGLRNALWENVPGVLSTDDNAFGCFLGALVGADDALHLPSGIGRWPDAGMVAGPRARAAWRVLDAQYFGLAQRRERVFVVVDFGNGADPAAVLFEPQGLQGNSAPRREAGQVAAATVTASAGGCSGKDGIDGRLAYGGG